MTESDSNMPRSALLLLAAAPTEEVDLVASVVSSSTSPPFIFAKHIFSLYDIHTDLIESGSLLSKLKLNG